MTIAPLLRYSTAPRRLITDLLITEPDSLRAYDLPYPALCWRYDPNGQVERASANNLFSSAGTVAPWQRRSLSPREQKGCNQHGIRRTVAKSRGAKTECGLSLRPPTVSRRTGRSSHADAVAKATKPAAVLLRIPSCLAVPEESHPGRAPESLEKSKNLNPKTSPYLLTDSRKKAQKAQKISRKDEKEGQKTE